MSLDDYFDFELFEMSHISNEFETPFGESEDSDTTGLTPQTPLSLPLHGEPSLLKSNSFVSSSDFHVDSLDQNSINGKSCNCSELPPRWTYTVHLDITQTSGLGDIFSYFSDVDALNNNVVNETVKSYDTFFNTNSSSARPNDASIPSNSLTTQLSVNYDASCATQSQHPLTCSSDTQDIVQNVYTNAAPQPETSLQPAQPPATSFPYPLPDYAGTSTTELQTAQPSNSSFQQHLPPYSDDTTGLAAVGASQTAHPSTSSYYSLPYPYNTAVLTPNTGQPPTFSLPHPTSYGIVEPNTARSLSSTTQVPRPSKTPGPSRPYATYNAPINMPRSLPPTQPSITSFRPPLYGNVGANAGESLNRAQPYTSSSSLQNVLSNTAESTRLPQQSSTSLPHQPSSSSAGYDSSVNWNAAYAALGLGNWDNYNTNADFVNVNDVSHTQSAQLATSNETFYATQPQYYTVNPGLRSQDIRQRTFSNVSTAQYLSALHNAETSISSYTQSTNNTGSFPVQPQYYTLNQNSGPQNTNQVGFTNVLQSSKASAQHSSTPGINGMFQHTWQSTEVPVNNDAFFAFQVNRGSRLQNTASQGRFTNVPLQPSTTSFQTTARQNMAKSVPMTQPFNPAFSGSFNLSDNLDNFPTTSRSNVVISNVAQQNARSQVPGTLPNTNGHLDNRNIQGTHTNLIVSNPSSVASQRLMNTPNDISMTRYNAYATVLNDEVPPTSGVPSVELVNQQQFLYPAPLLYTVSGQAQGGIYYPPFVKFPGANSFPNTRNHGHPAGTIPVPTRPAFAHQPAPITHQSRPVTILPPFPIPGSTSSTSMTSTRTKRKRVNNDKEEPPTDGKQKRRREK
ncbi:hypothetical protein Clacol_008763 [Clathrus columnatus]|uniref:Uncharacterized protein n=1 Tax=Clathrus columnatus TaxID=1419009 RepID=A0AAV5AP87_9AGAM|nr:hypothetical protein Clacol_008763 [Clathrus columnatus]